MTSTPTRLQALRDQFPAWGIDAMLITSASNRRWLSGFSGSAGSLLVTPTEAILSTDSRYWEQAAAQAPDFELFKDGRRPADLPAFIGRAGDVTIGLEANQLTLAAAEKLHEIDGPAWKPLAETVEILRQIKDADEIERIRAAAAITDSAMAQVPALLRPGLTERALAWALEQHMRENGADGLAFDTIVAFGPHAARPHHHPGERALSANEIVLVDMGAALDGYCSDMTRTFFYGAPDDKFMTVYNTVLAAEEAALAAVRPGLDSQAAHAVAADVIAAAGYGDYFGHGLGHGVGLDIHEAPGLSPIRTAVPLAAGMTVTIEPGIYLPGWGGVRVEDLGVITAEGVETLSHAPKEPVVGS
jgi:Xaa-Pro aminopeptidase